MSDEIVEDEKAIQEILNSYLENMATGSLTFWNNNCTSQCEVINGGDGSTMSAVAYGTFIKEQHEQGVHVLELPRSRSISVVGEIANVRMEWRFELGDDVFYGTTFFNLVKYGDGWKVTQKIYYIVP